MSGIILQEEDSAQTVMDYLPKKISSGISQQAESFVKTQPQKTTTNFRMNDLVSQHTGIHEIEKSSHEAKIELKVVERLKEVQEQAFKQAYELGLEEGNKRGYEESKEVISQCLQQVNTLIEQIINIKANIMQRNEAQFIDMVFSMASKIAYEHIEKNPARIAPVIKKAMESLQKDESMIIKVNPEDIKVIEDLKASAQQEFEYLTRAKLEPVDTVKKGGCIIETNYGLIDATIEERVKKLWEVLENTKPNDKRDEFK